MKRIRHAISACSTSKFAIVLCTIFLIFDFIAIFFLCDKIANIIIGITTGLIATISFYIFTRYTESIATIFEIQHLTTILIDDISNIYNEAKNIDMMIKTINDYQFNVSFLSNKIVYKDDIFDLLKKIKALNDKIKSPNNDYSKEIAEIKDARDFLLD